MKPRNAIAATVLLAAAAGLVLAGPLNPPAGPVGPTMKTLTEVEPRAAVSSANTPGDATTLFRITQPGSYYLAGNITGSSGIPAITVTVPGVTIDLNGFTISGGTSGVATTNIAGGLTLRNGFVKGCTGEGLYLPLLNWCLIESVVVQECGSTGMNLPEEATVRDSRVWRCHGVGVLGSYNTLLERCTVSGGDTHGVSLTDSARLVNCTLSLNWGSGLVLTGKGGLVTGCTADSNHVHGFQVTDATIDGCTAHFNTGRGFELGDRSTIRRSQAWENFQQGIHGHDRCTIIANECRKNSYGGSQYAGLWVDGVGSRVEENDVTENGYGVYVNGSNNFVVKNIAGGNTNGDYTLGGSNNTGPVVANPTGATLAGMSPWSNISH